MNPEEVEERLQAYFRAEEREMEVPLPTWERLSPHLGEQKRARRLLRLPFDDLSFARRGKLYGVLASLLGLIILAGVFYAPRPWGGGSLTPAAAFAAALDDLLKVESVHVVVEEYRVGPTKYHSKGFPFDFSLFDFLGVRWSMLDSIEGFNTVLIEAEMACPKEGPIVPGPDCPGYFVKLGTGGRVTFAYSTMSGRVIIEGSFLPPDTYHYWTNFEPENPRGLDNCPAEYGCGSYENLYVDGILYGRPGRDGLTPGGVNSNWRVIPQHGSFASNREQAFGGLFDQHPEGTDALPSLLDRFDTVERLPDTDLDGLLVEHYRAERAFDEGPFGEPGSEVVELWLGKEDRLARKITRKGDWEPEWAWEPDDYAYRWESTYTFSNFNQPVTIPNPWEDAP